MKKHTMLFLPQVRPPASPHGCSTCLKHFRVVPKRSMGKNIQISVSNSLYLFILTSLIFIDWNFRTYRKSFVGSKMVGKMSQWNVTRRHTHFRLTCVHVLQHCFKCSCWHIWKINGFIWTVSLRWQSCHILVLSFSVSTWVKAIPIQKRALI